MSRRPKQHCRAYRRKPGRRHETERLHYCRVPYTSIGHGMLPSPKPSTGTSWMSRSPAGWSGGREIEPALSREGPFFTPHASPAFALPSRLRQRLRSWAVEVESIRLPLSIRGRMGQSMILPPYMGSQGEIIPQPSLTTRELKDTAGAGLNSGGCHPPMLCSGDALGLSNDKAECKIVSIPLSRNTPPCR
jgi:hypothetical protein